MKHDELKEKIYELYDGELTGEEKKVVLGHLESCSECRGEISEWRFLAKAAFNKTQPSASEAFVQAVMRKISAADEGAPERNVLQWLFPTLSLATALLVFSLTFLRVGETVAAEVLILSNSSSVSQSNLDVIDLLED